MAKKKSPAWQRNKGAPTNAAFKRSAKTAKKK